MKLSYYDHMGDDLTTVDMARASYKNKSNGEFLTERDINLIKFLGRENHIIPFAHAHVTLHWEVPFALKNQLAKHLVGLKIAEQMPWTETSRRYTAKEISFYYPEYIRQTGSTNKQGSIDEPHPDSDEIIRELQESDKKRYEEYIDLLERGVPLEQARFKLPENTYTHWYWTGSLLAWSRVYNLRTGDGAQKDLLPLMEELNNIMQDLFPVSWEALTSD